MKNFILLFLSLCFVSTEIFAQQHNCHTTQHPSDVAAIKARLLKNKEALRTNPVQNRDIVYVPITFHLVADGAGEGRAPLTDVYGELCYINEIYASTGIQFYVKTTHNIDNNTLYENHSQATYFMEEMRDPEALNIFVTKEANLGNGLGTTLGYYFPNNDWLVMRISELNKDGVVLSHEIGHCFSLLHPSNGWDSFSTDIEPGVPAPATVANGTPAELADGSNCEIAGDYICDTPADYALNLSFYDLTCNNYNGEFLDPTGTSIYPDFHNIMAYYNCYDGIPKHFSVQQGEVMLQDYNSEERAYLQHDYIPSFGNLDNTTLLSPINVETTPFYNVIDFEWEAVDNAEAYILDIAKNATFTVEHRSFLIQETTATIYDFTSLALYYWQVTPINESGACLNLPPPIETFRSGVNAVSTNDIPSIKELHISPNPAKINNHVTIQLESDKNIELTLELINTTGQTMKVFKNIETVEGINQMKINLDKLSQGVYFIRLTHETGSTTKKIVIRH